MILDRIIGGLAIIGFVAFVSILFRVTDPALKIVLGLVVAMAAWDFWLTLRPASQKRRKDRAEGTGSGDG